MKALTLVSTNPPKLSIEEVAVPATSPNGVLVQVKAAALNRRDYWISEGKYPGLKQGAILGSDGCGVVVEVGQNVPQDWLGKRIIINPNIQWGDQKMAQSSSYSILGMPHNGTFAGYVSVPVDRLVPAPAHLTDEQAAAVPLAGLTAYRAVFSKANVQPGQRVLVTGIGGGVSQFAMQFAKHAGAEVFVSSRSNEKIQRAIFYGADQGLHNQHEAIRDEVNRASLSFDVIIDSLGGGYLNEYLHFLNPGGKIILYGATLGNAGKLDLAKVFWKQISILGTTMGSDEEFADMVALIEKHQIVPIIDSIRPFDYILQALGEMSTGQQFGKLVLTMGS